MKRKIFMKRAQSRGDSGFARVLTMLAMLFVAATGAWAQEWISGITNGDFSGDDVSSFCKKEYPSTDVVPVVIGANVGKDGTPGIVVKSGDDTANPNAQNYDTQLWIVLSEEIPAGSTIRVQFDYKASKAVKGSTEYHAAPQSYLTWQAIGDVNFTTEWKTFSGEFTIPKEADGMKSIAFKLQEEKSATDYYFDNFSVSYKKTQWTNIVVNSNMEGTDVSCFYVKEQGGEDMFLPRITEGIGMDGSRAIKVQSSDNEPNSWDTQFHIRLPYVLPAGTMYRLSFDYKTDKAGEEFGFQLANEPNQYIWWTLDGWPAPSISTDESNVNKWQHYKKVFVVPAECDGVTKADDNDWLRQFRTIYVNLAGNKVATESIFDNVKVEILSDVVSTLTPEPVTDPELMIMAPPYTVSLAEGTDDADNWTITPAEAAKGETVTVKYSGTKKVKSVMAALKAVNTGASAEEATVNYALSSTDVFKSGQTVDVKNGNDVVATITYGEAGGADFKTPKSDSHVAGYTVFTEGNGTNGNNTGGTFYTIVPAYDGTINVAVVLNADKAFYVLEDGTALTDYNGITVAAKYYGTYSINVSAGKSYKIYCAGSKLGFYGFEYIYTATADTPTDVALTPTDNANEWTFTMPACDTELVIEYDAVPTGIESISSNSTVNNTKAAWYNLNGQRVAQPTKGLFIRNGKKIVIK